MILTQSAGRSCAETLRFFKDGTDRGKVRERMGKSNESKTPDGQGQTVFEKACDEVLKGFDLDIPKCHRVVMPREAKMAAGSIFSGMGMPAHKISYFGKIAIENDGAV